MIDYIIFVLLIILIVLAILILLKKDDDKDIVERLGKLEKNVSSDLADFKFDINKFLVEDFNKLNDKIEQKLLLINEKVNERIDQNFEKTNKTFNSVLERLTKIDEAQKKIDSLSSEIVGLQSVLTDKKTRGIFGEVNLNYILTSVFGDKKGTVYDVQHTMSNGYIADSILFAPEPLGTICIDSKFPLENFEKMTDKTLSQSERDNAMKLFKSDVKKHIDAISSKYIIPGETSEEAIMFLPAEAIFAEINAYHPELLKYSFEKRVWICSPTTLMSTLTIIQMILKNIERDKYAKVIHVELNKLSREFVKYRERWDKLSRSIDTVTKDIKDINITTEKITKRFDSINSVDVGLLDYSDNEEV
ncbi:MAG: DNA recombination protein RmuC [Candidatus Coprovivens sp.]